MSDRVWILDDDDSIRWVLERAFSDAGWETQLFAHPDSFFAACESAARDRVWPDLVLTDVRMPGRDGLQVLKKLQETAPRLPVLVMTAHSDLDSAVSAFKGGAFEYLAKPFDLDEVLQVADRAVRDRSGTTHKPPLKPVSEIIGEAPAMQEVFRAIGRLSRSSISVLLTGASGTGKELVAHALHKHSSRADKPFIALNMAAIPADLIESELFGHEKGAFTGALQKRIGRFQQADGGTLFLDEIGDMPVEVQTRLLRVLAEGKFYPVGSHQLVSADVRIIAATHQDLRKAVAAGRFREDLYHRLNVIHIRLPTLTERREDIAALAQHFLQLAAADLGMAVKKLSPDALRLMEAAPWPGNVRQLENTCRWLTVMAPSDDVAARDLPDDMQMTVSDAGEMTWEQLLRDELERAFKTQAADSFQPFEVEFTRIAIESALKTTGGHRQQAAKILGWGRNTLTRKMKT
ncbi:nitrogen regulation protein NR(I) [Aliidiomarina sp. Khilg15.8]